MICTTGARGRSLKLVLEHVFQGRALPIGGGRAAAGGAVAVNVEPARLTDRAIAILPLAGDLARRDGGGVDIELKLGAALTEARFLHLHFGQVLVGSSEVDGHLDFRTDTADEGRGHDKAHG